MRRPTWAAAVVLTSVTLIAAAGAQTRWNGSMNEIAERYVRLVLAVGQHDPDYVDAFYGPAEWKDAAARDKRPLSALGDEASRLIADMPPPSSRDGDPLTPLRREYLLGQVRSLQARVRMLQGTRLTFDEESKALYDAVAPEHPASDFDRALGELDALLPGPGSLIERVDRFRHDFIIPTDRLARVFDRTIEECRSRTRAHVELPAGESFRVEYVTNKAWSGYNWYQGQYHSVIQVNTDLPIYVDRAVDLACHEGYPGHHVYNVRLEQQLVRGRGWIEYTIYPLFSPQSLIAEGTANYGIDVAFPGEERTAFERDVVFPLAGLDATRAAEYARVLALADRLSYAGNEAARSYLNGRMDRRQAAEWLVQYALMSPSRAEQRVRFFDQYRSYVINYNLGKDLVKAHVESQAGRSRDARWQAFTELISSPRLQSGLRSAVQP